MHTTDACRHRLRMVRRDRREVNVKSGWLPIVFYSASIAVDP